MRAAGLVCTALAVAAGSLVFVGSVLPGIPPDHPDEAGHAVLGLLMAHHLRGGDFVNLAFDLYRQVYWPPLHPLVLGLAHTVFGPGIVVARALSVLAYVLAALVLYRAGRHVCPEAPDLAGVVAALAFLTSPALVHFASWCMLELPGVLAVAATLLVWVRRARNPGSPRTYTALGLGIAAAYFTKSNYGVLLALAVGLEFLSRARWRPARVLTPEVGYTVLPLAVLLALWFAYPPKILSTWRTLLNQPWGVREALSVEGLLYFPLAFGRLAGSPVVLVLYLLAVGHALRRRADPALRLPLWVIGLQFALGELHHTKLDRHLFPILPAVFLLLGAGAGPLARTLAARPRVRLFLAALLLAQGGYLFACGLRPPPAHGPSRQVVAHAAARLREVGPALLLATKDLPRPSISVLDWYLIVREKLLAPVGAGTATPAAEVVQVERLLARLGRPRWLARLWGPILRRRLLPGPVYTLYVGAPPYGFLDPKAFTAFFAEYTRARSIRRVVLMTSRYPGARHPAAFFIAALEHAGFRLRSRRVFAEPRVQVEVWDRAP